MPKLKNNGIIILFNSREVVDWLHLLDVNLEFTTLLAEGTFIRPQQYVMLVPQIPVHLNPTDDKHLREIK